MEQNKHFLDEQEDMIVGQSSRINARNEAIKEHKQSPPTDLRSLRCVSYQIGEDLVKHFTEWFKRVSK